MDLQDFLIKAKINTYASNGKGSKLVLENGGKKLVYKDGDFEYQDVYFGFDPFVGEEIVLKEGKTVWVMNYSGRILFEDLVSTKKIYSFLKKAMRQVGSDSPYRGPDNFIDGDFEYKDENKGTLEFFSGNEKIYFKGTKVYELIYHGGLIKRKKLLF